MSNSPLVTYTNLSPNAGNYSDGVFVGRGRWNKIDTITIHCVVGQTSVETLGQIFGNPNTGSSCNYGIGFDGRVGLYCNENERSWCSSSAANDNRAITIECASDLYSPYAVNSAVYKSLIELCADICKRNGIKKLIWKGDSSLIGCPNLQNMTVHRWFANKACPGDYLYNRMGQIANDVNKKLGACSVVLFRVQTGAFAEKKNADAMLKKVKAAGFDTYMVKVNHLYKIQVGAYSKRNNAEAMKKKLTGAGFEAFITTEGGEPADICKSIDEVAQEVIAGQWGTGEDRKERLISAGYDYDVVQKRVNELV